MGRVNHGEEFKLRVLVRISFYLDIMFQVLLRDDRMGGGA